MGKALFMPNLPKVTNGDRGFRRVFIANRGEICCRIIRTCRILDLTSITIFTDEDANSRHVAEADEAINLGSVNKEKGNPFLNIELLIQVATKADADTIHPGYGYLSENADFADAVRNAGMVFLGPSSQAILTLGDKRQSKEYLRKHGHGIPLIPGFAGKSQDLSELGRAADDIGYPVMLKASAGGGGKGIRIIHAKKDLEAELDRAQSEARRSFGSSDCILEKYIEAGKHVEVQIIGDSHGQVLSLFERECSVQRRHQKIIEESPSPWLTQSMRKDMCDAACEIGKLIGYEGAGTVEFIVDVKSAKFYFLEVNSRIQVEHPITEEVTGVDIVALQLFVAAGGSLKNLPLADLSQTGHAIECRLYAENPQRDFLPELGTIHLWKPAGSNIVNNEDIRYETAVASGTEITMFFDPMIAKIIVWAPNRDSAIRKMVSVLANTACVGLTTNQLFLQCCLLHPGFQDTAYTTSFISHNLQDLLMHPQQDKLERIWNKLAAIPAAYLKGQEAISGQCNFRHVKTRFRNQSRDKVNAFTQLFSVGAQKAISSNMRFDTPVLCTWKDGFANAPLLYQTSLASTLETVRTAAQYEKLTAAQRLAALYNAISNLMRTEAVIAQPRIHVDILSSNSMYVEYVHGHYMPVTELAMEVDGNRVSGILVFPNGNSYAAAHHDIAKPQRILFHTPVLGTWIAFEAFNLLTYIESLRKTTIDGVNVSDKGIVFAPMPCKILRLLKKNGDTVKAGETVLVVESMKMEMAISVNKDGQLKCTLEEGQAMSEGDVLCSVE